MGLRLTTKVQVSGWRFLLRRLEHAIVRRDTRMFDDPLQFYSRSMGIGIVAALLIVLGAGALALFKPQGSVGGGTLLADGRSFQLYVDIAGRLHPVFNLTSARLVLGSPADPTVVKTSELNGMPKGHWVGIPGAPHDTPVSGSESTWTICDTVTNPHSAAPKVHTAVIAMPLSTDSSIDPVESDEGVLVEFDGQEWLVTEHGRHAIDRANRALTSAVGIPVNADPAPVSESLFNALPDAGPWQLPPIGGAGAPNTLGLPPEFVNGSVFQIHAPSGPRYYVVLPQGVAQINATTAAALRATASYGLLELPTLEASAVAPLPEVAYPSPLPDTPVALLPPKEEPTLCWSWERQSGDQDPKVTVYSGRHLPITAAEMDDGIAQIRGPATVYIDGGKFVRLQSPDPRYGEALYYIDTEGVRYGIADAQTAAALGLSSPSFAPWEIVRVLVEGPVLSKEAALVEHDSLAVNASLQPVEPGVG